MSENQENQEKGVFENFIGNIETHLSNLVNLEVKTIVSDYNESGNIITRKDGSDVKVISTTMNLIQGDVVTHVSEGLVDDKYTWLREFHSRKEEQGHAIIHNNVKALYSVFELYQKTKANDFSSPSVEEGGDALYSASAYE